eukprot:scaffold43663_cov32-Tisochrysis_lutea.AAC.4
MRWPSVVNNKETPWVLTKLASSKRRNRYLSVSARKKEGMWSCCFLFWTDESAAKPPGTLMKRSMDVTISAPIARYRPSAGPLTGPPSLPVTSDCVAMCSA